MADVYLSLPITDVSLIPGAVSGTGVAGQVSYWSGAQTQTGSAGFTFAANTLSIGDNTSSGHLWITTLAGRQSSIHFQTNDVVRWDLQKNNTVEGGANAGSDFNIIAYSDAGAQLDIPLSIARVLGGSFTVARPASFSYGANAYTFAIGENTTAGATLSINGAAANAKQIVMQTAGLARWTAGANALAESGANAGSAFFVSAYTDAGALIDSPLTIVRASGGAFTVNRQAAFLEGTNPYTLSVGGNTTNTGSAVVINGTVGGTRSLQFKTAGSTRWVIAGNNNAESGSNAGTNFVVAAYTDVGVLIDIPLTINRAAAGTITWSAGRNMGVGIVPTAKLHLDGGNATTTVLKFTAGTTTGTTSTDGTDFGVNGAGDTVIINREVTDMIFYTSGTERFRVLAGGNLQHTSSNPLINIINSSDTNTITSIGTYAAANLCQMSYNRVPSTGVIGNAALSAAYITLGGPTTGSYLSVAVADAINTTPGEAFRVNLTKVITRESVKLGLGFAAATALSYDLSISGQAAKTIGMERHTTANTAGNNLSINAGSATSAATDKAGGNLVLKPGLSTGTGSGYVAVQRLERSATTGTADNALYDGLIIAPPKHLANNTATGVFDVALPAGSSAGGHCNYVIECTNGTDYHSSAGIMHWAAVNKGGVYTMTIGHTLAASGLEVDADSSGTLADAWTMVSGTNKVTPTLNANSTLTPTVLKVWMTIFNNSSKAITLL
jgi:hypothetical protein